jgi:hypothetical protein
MASGETVLERAQVTDVGRAQNTHKTIGELVLTDRRIVVTLSSTNGAWGFGVVGALLNAAFGERTRIEYQIRRDEFGEVEVTGPKELKVRSKGEGYAMSWFEVRIKDPDEWAQRLHRWASGGSHNATLPTAKLVDR